MSGPADPQELLRNVDHVTVRTRQLVDPRARRQLLVWSVVYFLGYGALWADVALRRGVPWFGLGGLFAAAVVGFISTALELRRLRGLFGQATDRVRRATVSWVLAAIGFWVVMTLVLLRRPDVSARDIAVIAAAAAVGPVGGWLLCTGTGAGYEPALGLGLITVSLAGLALPPDATAVMIVWLASSALFLGAYFHSKVTHAAAEHGDASRD
ncbi:MAG: hypothetical protein Q4D79_04285 [Propionibacteriaceae bacterium]|nr:hypothetical protein [Propionibacteriaceae bacterium]